MKKGFSNPCLLRLKPRSKPLIVGNIYRSPSGSVSSFLQILDVVLEAIHPKSRELVIMGEIHELVQPEFFFFLDRLCGAKFCIDVFCIDKKF